MKEINTVIPKKKELIKLEKKARVDGSGINFKSLIGLWKFKSVWKQASDKEDSISSTFLQVLSASLELRKADENQDDEQFAISNSIQLGLISIRFTGLANLERKQPLLPFYFDCIQIKLGAIVVLKKSLPIPEKNKRPFFALIAMDNDGKWLSARGKGGGLALWTKVNEQSLTNK